MICPKCKSEGQEGNFCSNCGLHLRKNGVILWKKCPTCGRLEPADRKVCFSKIEEAKRALADFIGNQKKKWQRRILHNLEFLVMIALIIIWGIVIFYFTGYSPESYRKIQESEFGRQLFALFFLLSIALIFLTGLILRYVIARLEKKLEQKDYTKFLEEAPYYAETLRSAE